MKNLFLTIGLILTLVLGSACTKQHLDYTVDLAMINSDYNLLVERYDTLRSLTLSKWEMFSTEDKIKLGTINDNVERIIHKADTLRSFQLYKVTPADLGYMYTLGKQSYEMAREIYMTYEDQLSYSESLSIKLFDERLRDLDTQMTNVLEDPQNADINHTLISILAVASTGLKLLLPLVI